MPRPQLRTVKNADREFSDASAHVRNPRLEQELLGIPLWLRENGHEAECLKTVGYILQQDVEMFTTHRHRELQRAYGVIDQRGLVPTEGRLQAVLSTSDMWCEDERDESRITPGYLAALSELGSCKSQMTLGIGPLPLARELASELRAVWRKRQLIDATDDLRALLANPSASRDEVADAISALQRIDSQRPNREETAQTLDSIIRADIEATERSMAGDEVPRIVTGFPALDQMTGGFSPGNLIVLAARTSMGKTALATDVALKAARDSRFIVYFTFEMTCREIGQRIAAKTNRSSILRHRNNNLADWQLDSYRQKHAEGEFSLPLIIDEANYTPDGIKQRIREYNRMVAPGAVELVIVDHLQIMGVRDTTRYERRDRQIAAYTGQLKDMAKRLDLSVLALSQLNRQGDNRPEDQRSPRLSDLRESGAIEQDADCVIGLYRKHQDTHADEDRNHAEIVVLKNRSGPTGRIPLTWVPELGKFSDPSRDEEFDPSTVHLDHV